MDPLVNGTASGVGLTRYQINGGAFAVSEGAVAAFGLDGPYQVGFQSQDRVGNQELLRSATLYVDATAPVSALGFGGGRQYRGPDPASFFGSSDTTLSLSAYDPAIEGVASGVASTWFRDNGGEPRAYSMPLVFAEGIHDISYRSEDNVQNVEVWRSTRALIDATAPRTSLAVLGGHQLQGADPVSFYASSDTRLALLAVDPSVNGAASGVGLTQYQDNGGAFQTYVSSFSLAEGAHELAYQSQDQVSNREVLLSTNI